MATKIFINGREEDLEYTVAQRDILESQLERFISILDGTRHYIKKNNDIYFTVLIRIWKYASTIDERREQFLQFYDYQYSTCYLQPDEWWGWIRSEENNNVLFKIIEVSAYPFTDANSPYDMCVMRFKSINYIDAQPTVLRRENYPDGTDGSPIITDDDQQIILDI